MTKPILMFPAVFLDPSRPFSRWYFDYDKSAYSLKNPFTFLAVLTTKATVSLNSINRLVSVAEL
jgi:hypothetical protein